VLQHRTFVGIRYIVILLYTTLCERVLRRILRRAIDGLLEVRVCDLQVVSTGYFFGISKPGADDVQREFRLQLRLTCAPKILPGLSRAK